MPKNYSNQLAGQIGESLVVAELGRRGVVATAFAGNVPDIDILAYKGGKSLALQVKAWRSGSVSFDARNYLSIEFDGEYQSVMGFSKEHRTELIYVFVQVAEQIGRDHFYILNEQNLAKIISQNYQSFLLKHAGRRPRNHSTTHCAVSEDDLQPYLNNWQMIDVAMS